MKITAIYDTTEFDSKPASENEYTKFTITNESLTIQILDAGSTVLETTEIEIKDAIQLANLILTLNK